MPGVVPIESGDLFQHPASSCRACCRSLVIVMAMIWPLALVLIGMVYLMAANERRRELGMLRALGATRRFICRSLLAEASLLAFCGAAAGAFLAVLGIYLFRRLIVATLGVPFLLPSPGSVACPDRGRTAARDGECLPGRPASGARRSAGRIRRSLCGSSCHDQTGQCNQDLHAGKRRPCFKQCAGSTSRSARLSLRLSSDVQGRARRLFSTWLPGLTQANLGQVHFLDGVDLWETDGPAAVQICEIRRLALSSSSPACCPR